MNNFKVSIRKSKSLPIIIIYCDGKRHRYWSGKAIEIKLRCIDNPTLLKSAFELKLREGWRPQLKKKIVKEVPITVIKALKQGVELKIKQGCSERFIKDSKRIVILWKRYESEQHLKSLTLDKLQPSHIRNFPCKTQLECKDTTYCKIYFKSVIS